MTCIALLLLAVVLGVVLHKVRDSYSVLYSMSRVTAKDRMTQHDRSIEYVVQCRTVNLCVGTEAVKLFPSLIMH